MDNRVDEVSCKKAKMENGLVSNHDEKVLSAIFNPEQPYKEVKPLEDTENDTIIVQHAKRLEEEGVKAAEAGDLQTALGRFTEAITLEPTRPSGYNNRAQALRLLGDNEGAYNDLNTAIDLSKGEGRSAAMAFTQRGLLRKLDGNDSGALKDFQSAACLGEEFAQSMVVKLNPYAALCNQMLGEMFDHIRNGEHV